MRCGSEAFHFLSSARQVIACNKCWEPSRGNLCRIWMLLPNAHPDPLSHIHVGRAVECRADRRSHRERTGPRDEWWIMNIKSFSFWRILPAVLIPFPLSVFKEWTHVQLKGKGFMVKYMFQTQTQRLRLIVLVNISDCIVSKNDFLFI